MYKINLDIDLKALNKRVALRLLMDSILKLFLLLLHFSYCTVDNEEADKKQLFSGRSLYHIKGEYLVANI